MKWKRVVRFVLLAAPAMLLSGCATSALWEEGRFANFHEPAKPSNLRVFESREKHDFLVCYDELRERDQKIQPRAYWLVANHEPVKNPHKPRFVSVQKAQGLTLIPVFDASQSNAPPASGLYAVTSFNDEDFTLYSGPKDLGAYELPMYRDSSGRVKQVLLTPPAVVADIAIVGVVIAVATLPEWWESLNDVTH